MSKLLQGMDSLSVFYLYPLTSLLRRFELRRAKSTSSVQDIVWLWLCSILKVRAVTYAVCFSGADTIQTGPEILGLSSEMHPPLDRS